MQFVDSNEPKVGRIQIIRTQSPVQLLLLLCIICGFGTASGQRITVSQEIVLKEDRGYDILANMNGRILLFQDKGSNYEVRSYDEQMQLRGEYTLELEKKNSDLISIVAGENQFHLIYGYRHRGDYIIMDRAYSSELVLTDTVVVHVDEKEFFTPRYIAAVSEDRTKILLYQAERENQISVLVYSIPTREVLWRKETLMRSGSVRNDFRNMLVSNDGDVAIVLDNQRVSDRNRIFDMIYIDAETETVSTTNVSLGDLVATDAYFSIDNVNRRVLISGLFGEHSSSKSKGIYLSMVSLPDLGVQLRTLLFNEEILQNIYGKEVSPKKGLTNFSVQDVALREDGGAMIIAEMKKEYSRRPNMPGRREFGYAHGGWVDYYYEDLIVFAIHPDGSEHWSTVLHKKQYSQDDDAMYSSYFLFKTPEMIRLLFNDEIRQENMVSEYAIRGNGYYRRQSVFSTDYQRLRLRLRDAVQISHHECIVPSERNGRLSLVKITFDDKER